MRHKFEDSNLMTDAPAIEDLMPHAPAVLSNIEVHWTSVDNRLVSYVDKDAIVAGSYMLPYCTEDP